MVIACDQVALSKNQGFEAPVLTGSLILFLFLAGLVPCRSGDCGTLFNENELHIVKAGQAVARVWKIGDECFWRRESWFASSA